jgi:flagellar basal body-associated protein FliL
LGKSITKYGAAFAAAAILAFAGGYGMGILQTDQANAEDGVQASRPDEASSPDYVPVGQIVVPLLAAGRTDAFILAQVTLEASGPDAADDLRRRMPHVRNAVLQSLFGLAGAGVFDGPSIEPGAVAQAIRLATNEQLGREGVRRVLIDRLLRQENRRR